MKWYAITENGYYLAVGRGACEQETGISEQEYAEILTAIRNKPTPRDGYDYLLKTDLTWEEYALPPVEPEPLTDEDALVRYANTLTGQNDPDLISAEETLKPNESRR